MPDNEYYELTPDRPPGWTPPVTTTRNFDLAAAWKWFAERFDEQAKDDRPRGRYDSKGYIAYEERKTMEGRV